jgi:undecaprenyl-diphosphatase
VRAALEAHGWREPVALTAASALAWLSPAPDLAAVPLLPQVHDGRHEALRMLGPQPTPPPAGGGSAAERAVLRLWSAGVELEPGATPVWIGSASYEELKEIVLLSIPVSASGYGAACDAVREAAAGAAVRVEERTPPAGGGVDAARAGGAVRCGDAVLLVRGE